MKRSTRKEKKRFGALPPLYQFVLNPYTDVRFSTCPGCRGRTRQRKLPLLIHVDPMQLIALNKTCRYCPDCDLLIAHQDELEAFLTAFLGERASEVLDNDGYLVLGTMERKAWREGLHQPKYIDDMRANTHDFKEYRTVQVTPGGWFPADKPPAPTPLVERS